jgi:hypothetical protein
MPKEEKKRTFDSETLILPALKMVLVNTEKSDMHQPAKKGNQKVTRDLKEETVLRIIDKLIAKE